MSKLKTHYRTIFISDIHLGSRGAQAEHLSEFLAQNSCDTLYCVGDILDIWALKRKAYFPTSHQNIVRKIIKRATSGTKVFYTPGNHDEAVREFIPLTLDNVFVADEFVHETADGKRFLVIHGDQFDPVTNHHKWIAHVGDIGYSLLLRCNRYVNAYRRWRGLSYWSISAYIKLRVKTAVSFIGEYEQSVSRSVRELGLDGVICGHIHHAEIRTMSDVIYMNTGDWVESCTALVEHDDGRMEIVRWAVADQLAAAA